MKTRLRWSRGEVTITSAELRQRLLEEVTQVDQSIKRTTIRVMPARTRVARHEALVSYRRWVFEAIRCLDDGANPAPITRHGSHVRPRRGLKTPNPYTQSGGDHGPLLNNRTAVKVRTGMRLRPRNAAGGRSAALQVGDCP